ncbi:MAG: NTP transferase domain-containing protein [Burkholderiaceae bacterium]|nr:NTP transferase domain-containing protein [Burkholderiaceae bacterium]
MNEPRIVAFVLAGGEGARLRPFTNEVPKPAPSCAGHCRVIDFALSNLHNSSIRSIFVLLQYKPQILVEHLAAHWSPHGLGEFVEPVLSASPWRGTADAVRQSLDLLDATRADLVAVFAADHVYRMDVRQMAAFHLEHDADATVAALPVPLDQARQFGVIRSAADGRITGFDEKPAHPACCPSDRSAACVSMGNYLFRPHVLRHALREAALRGGHDFGRDVLPQLVEQANVYAYDFRHNAVPGLMSCEEPVYWRDVGTVDAYFDAQQDARGRFPLLNLRNAAWPIRCTSATLPRAGAIYGIARLRAAEARLHAALT